MKQKHVEMYLRVAEEVAKTSSANRLKVGAVAVNPLKNIPVSFGYNALPEGVDGSCEYETENGLVTRPEVVHAEHNMILNMSKSTESSWGAWVFLTHSPCQKCSEMMVRAGIKKVFYVNEYRDTTPLKYLKRQGIEVEHVKL